MDRGSDLHNPGLDATDTHDADIVLERSDGSPAGQLSHEDVLARSELARHLRPSIFPADRYALLECAIDEHAPPDLLEQLAHLDAEVHFENVQQVWEALGGRKETLRPEVMRFEFRWDPAYRIAAMAFAVTPDRTFVEVNHRQSQLSARFGRWVVVTPLSNVVSAMVAGPYSLPKTIGPPRLSIADQGLTFATNHERGVCIRFRQRVRGIDPFGVIRHPALTVTVADPEALQAALT